MPFMYISIQPGSVAQLDARPTGEVAGSPPPPFPTPTPPTPLSRQHAFVEIDQEIISPVILSLLLSQEVQLSVSGENNTILVNCLED